MLYVIKAYEGSYEGLHGMVSYHIEEADSYETACEIAMKYSFEVMDDYGISENIREQVAEECPDLNDNEFDEVYEDWLRENVAYEVYKLDECDETFLDEFHDDPEAFIEKYCNV